MNGFKDLNIIPEILEALNFLGFTEPTEIQKKAIPILLASDKVDFHGQAQTGTGKTLAFGIPLLQRINTQNKATQAIVIAPTRELAVQISESIKSASKNLHINIATIYGGVSMPEQINALKRGAQLVIGTPGRLNDHIRRRTLNLQSTKTVVLDEADIMLDMGFKEEVEEIISKVSKEKEIWLFSATVKPGIKKIINDHMRDTVAIRTNKQQIGTQNTQQFFCVVPFKSRLQAIIRFLESTADFYGFVFCPTKILTAEIAQELTKRGYNVGALHGDMSQAQRNMIIKKFKSKQLNVVIATDVAARGIDVADLTHVINYSIPDDIENYVHRIGRTGRAGKQGIAITFVTRSEVRNIQQIEKKFNVKISSIEAPSKQEIIKSRLNNIKHYIESTDAVANSDVNSIKDLLANIAEPKLKNVLAKILYDKFLAHLELEDIPTSGNSSNFRSEQGGAEFQEITIGVGIEDGINKDDIRNFILKSGIIKNDQILSIRVIKRRSFVKVQNDCNPQIIEALRSHGIKGRRVRVNFTCMIN